MSNTLLATSKYMFTIHTPDDLLQFVTNMICNKYHIMMISDKVNPYLNSIKPTMIFSISPPPTPWAGHNIG